MRYLGSAHLQPYLLTEKRKEAVKTAIKALRGRAFEAIAVTGNSGTIFGGMLPWDQLAYRSTFRGRHRTGAIPPDYLPIINMLDILSVRVYVNGRALTTRVVPGETNQTKEYGYFVGATATSPTVVLLS